MIFISILIFILSMSLSFVKNKITPIFFTRITALVFIYAGALSFNVLYIQSIGSGISFYSGLFQISSYTLLLETFFYIIASIILLSWPLIYNKSKRIGFSFISEGDLKIGNEQVLLEEQMRPLSILNSNLKLNNSKGNFSNMIKKNVSTYKLKLNHTILHNSLQTNSTYSLENLCWIYSSTNKESIKYSLLVLFSTLGASLLISSNDLLSMYLSIELQSFALYILATIYRDSDSATSAGLKYFLLGGLSSCIILLGVAVLYTSTGLTNLESINSMISILDISASKVSDLPYMITKNYLDIQSEDFTILQSLNSFDVNNLQENNLIFSIRKFTDSISSTMQGIIIGLILIVVGFLFKIAGAPFHNWAPDVYDDSPTNITIWLTIMPKISIIIFLLELILGIALNLSSTELFTTSLLWKGNSEIIGEINISDTLVNEINSLSILKHIFLFSSLLSLIIGTVVGLAQLRIKRLLAYSTISHIGFILLAISITTESSTESLIFYIIQYTLTNLNTFLILLALGYILNSENLVQNSEGTLDKTKLKVFGMIEDLTNGNLRNPNSDITFIFTLRGLFISNPILSLSFIICLFSMAGIPPLIGFFGKQSVLLSAIGNGLYFISLVAILVSVISASYYLKIVKELHSFSTTTNNSYSNNSLSHSLNIREESALSHSSKITQQNNLVISSKTEPVIFYLSNPNTEQVKNILNSIESRNTYLSLTNIHSFFISILTLSILFYVLKPSILLNSVVLSTLSLFNL